MKAVIYTLGCKVNTYESEVISSLLSDAGYQVVDDDNCDVCVINTCTVTNNADRKSRKIINQAIRKNENAIVIVVGCFSQIRYQVLSENKRINIILGTNNKTKIIDCINEFRKTKEQIVLVNTSRNVAFENMQINNFNNKHRAFVKIQDGCNNFCSYCIIPYTRGTVRCKKVDIVIEEITSLVNNGFKEIVLTGIHTGSYYDSDCSFSKLLRKIVEIKGLKRLRISSIEVTELDDDFFELLESCQVIVDHLHIPLQSGSDKILKSMNRKYDTYFYKKIIDRIRSIRPDISITTDVIVGFPGETLDDFMDIYKFIDDMNFSSLHVFPYSKRDFTKAASMDNHVSDIEKQMRVDKLIALSDRKEFQYMNKFIGRKLDVLVETVDNNEYFGHASNYLKVKMHSMDNLVGKVVTVYVEDIKFPFCIGNVL